MHVSDYHYLPLAPLFYLALVLLWVVVVALIEVGLFRYASEKMGIDRRYIFALLLLCLTGGYVNVPLARLPAEQIYSGMVVRVFGVQYLVPIVRDWPGTVLAVNVGGALIPVALSIYLLLKHRLYFPAAIGVASITAVAHLVARPVPGLGIGVPMLLPALASAGIGLLLSHDRAAPLAYIAGTLGTLLGGDLLNLNVIRELGTPVASIGGAGTFDGVFLVGILAVLLA